MRVAAAVVAVVAVVVALLGAAAFSTEANQHDCHKPYPMAFLCG